MGSLISMTFAVIHLALLSSVTFCSLKLGPKGMSTIVCADLVAALLRNH